MSTDLFAQRRTAARRGERSEVRDQRSEIRGRRSEVRRQEAEEATERPTVVAVDFTVGPVAEGDVGGMEDVCARLQS
jgi:hypothetical protein